MKCGQMLPFPKLHYLIVNLRTINKDVSLPKVKFSLFPCSPSLSALRRLLIFQIFLRDSDCRQGTRVFSYLTVIECSRKIGNAEFSVILSSNQLHCVDIPIADSNFPNPWHEISIRGMGTYWQNISHRLMS